MSTAKPGGKNATPYIVAVAVTLFVIFLAYLMFFMPKISEGKTVRAETKQVAQEIRVLEATINQIDDDRTNLPVFAEDMAGFNRAFTLDPEQQRLFAAVTESAASAGVTVVSLNPEIPALAAGADSEELEEVTELDEDAVLAAVNFKIDARGSRDGLRRFMTSLETLDRPISITGFEIRQNDDTYTLGASLKTWMAAPLDPPALDGDKAEAAEDTATEDEE